MVVRFSLHHVLSFYLLSYLLNTQGVGPTGQEDIGEYGTALVYSTKMKSLSTV